MTTPLDWPSIVGLIGTAGIIGAYAYLTLAKATNPFQRYRTRLLESPPLTVSLLYFTNWTSLRLQGYGLNTRFARWEARGLTNFLARKAKFDRHQLNSPPMLTPY